MQQESVSSTLNGHHLDASNGDDKMKSDHAGCNSQAEDIKQSEDCNPGAGNAEEVSFSVKINAPNCEVFELQVRKLYLLCN